MNRLLRDFICWIVAGIVACGIYNYSIWRTKPVYLDGAIVCVVGGKPDVTIFSKKIRKIGEGQYEFKAGSGEMTLFEKGSMSSCLIAIRPKEEREKDDALDKDAPSSPPDFDKGVHDI